MKIKEQTRKLAAGCTWVRQGDVDVVWIWFSKSIRCQWRFNFSIFRVGIWLHIFNHGIWKIRIVKTSKVKLNNIRIILFSENMMSVISSSSSLNKLYTIAQWWCTFDNSLIWVLEDTSIKLLLILNDDQRAN